MQWIESGGGPLIAVPKLAVSVWEGAQEEESGYAEGVDDYARACAVTGYAGVITVGNVEALVLNDDPAPTAYLPDRRLFVRRLTSDSSDAELLIFLAREFEVLDWCDELFWEVRDNCVLFDSAFPGRDSEISGYLDIEIPEGRYSVSTANVEQDDLWLSVTRLKQST